MNSLDLNCGITIEHFADKTQRSLTCQSINNYTLIRECHIWNTNMRKIFVQPRCTALMLGSEARLVRVMRHFKFYSHVYMTSMKKTPSILWTFNRWSPFYLIFYDIKPPLHDNCSFFLTKYISWYYEQDLFYSTYDKKYVHLGWLIINVSYLQSTCTYNIY